MAPVDLGTLATGTLPQDGVPDMIVISDIEEHGINLNLKTRYCRDLIYTYTGTILIAVNPYKELPIYDSDNIFRYSGQKLRSLEPHVFAISEAAYHSLQISSQNQSCVISGESGAGKTETTKFILQYLCSVASSVSTWVEQQVLEANTILEAFGNAKTVRNDNSSRFGKFIQVCFDNKYHIKGCIIQDYLLEQSRIVFQSPEERNYHVFYRFVAAAQINPELQEQFMIEKAESYAYLNQSGCISIEGVDDVAMFDALRLALGVFDISLDMSNGLFSVLSAILWLGNLQFEDIDGEQCRMTYSDEDTTMKIAYLLGLSEEDIKDVALKRQICVRGNTMDIPFKLSEARDNRHAMAKALYSRTFSWLVHHINKCASPGQNVERFIGVLDIFGFENFTVNSFEQLCINYTNEKLHKFFNHYVFALEQETYREEEIAFSHIAFTDNTECLELIEKPPKCILKMLAEECKFPKATDLTLVAKLHQEFDAHPYYIKGEDRRRWELEFAILHYAGAVTYTIQGFLGKNRDSQQDQLMEFMQKSSNIFVQDLSKITEILESCFNNNITSGTASISKGTLKGKPVVADTFRYQVAQLVDVLQSTNPSYVRCIKPNTAKQANTYQDELVLIQLRYLGMLDIIRIRKEGYPIHMTFNLFLDRYKHLIPIDDLPSDKKEAVGKVLTNLNASEKEWQVGKTKVFLRNSVHEPLEEKLQNMWNSMACKIQKMWKGYVKRKEFLRKRKAAIVIQTYYRGMFQRLHFLRMRRAAIIIQSHLRGMFGREVSNALRRLRIEEEERKRQEELERERQEKQQKELDEIKELEESMSPISGETFQRLAEEELASLSRVAELNIKHAQESNETLDLDDMFHFLAEIANQEEGDEELEELPESEENLQNQNAIRNEVDEIFKDISRTPKYLIDDQKSKFTLELSETNAEVIVNSTETPELPPPPPDLLDDLIQEEDNLSPLRSPNSGIKSDTSLAKKSPMTDHLQSPIKFRKNSFSGSSGALNARRLRHDSSNLEKKRGFGSSRSVSSGDSIVREDAERDLRRKQRIEKKLHEMEANKENMRLQEEEDTIHYDMIEFAEKYFNTHPKDVGGSVMKSLRRKSGSSALPKYEMVTYTKSSAIPTSHVHLHDPGNITIACGIFKDLCKYIKGDIRGELVNLTIQSSISYGIEREELRDEIFCQLIRQSNNNPSKEGLERVWIFLCLCVIAFPPSKTLYKYMVSYLRKNCSNMDISRFAQWCLANLKKVHATPRRMPPSIMEIMVVCNLTTLVCRFYFMDGMTKAIDVHPSDTAGDVIKVLAHKMGLRNLEGWALYESSPEYEFSIRRLEYIADIISRWETLRRTSAIMTKYSTISKKGSNYTKALGGGESRFVFRKRVFKNPKEIPQDPVECHLLYAQAVNSVVNLDEFPVNEKIALQLAGLQAQVLLGDYEEDKWNRYDDIEQYLSKRIIQTRNSREEWAKIIADAHKQYGSGKSVLVAKVWYLTCVMQYPLYGTTQFPVSLSSITYKAYSRDSSNLILAIGHEGIMMVNTLDKFILNAFRYCDIESIQLDPTYSIVTVNLKKTVADAQKCYVFETNDKMEIASLIASYCPSLATWLKPAQEHSKKLHIKLTEEDRMKLYNEVVNCRKALVEAELLRRPPEESIGLFKSTLRKMTKSKLEKFKQEQASSQESDDFHKVYKQAYWSFTRTPINQSLMIIPDPESEDVAVRMFVSLLVYSGLCHSGGFEKPDDQDQTGIVQTVIEKCLNKELWLNEFYLQLIKQTTDHPDPNSKVNLRHWSFLAVVISIVAPSNELVLKYLQAHLRKCAADDVTEEGMYAQFCVKCLARTIETKGRKWPPSRQEILCTINRRPILARIQCMDGQLRAVEFDPSATTKEVLELIKTKMDLQPDSRGYSMYEVFGNMERNMLSTDKVGDAMYKWEKYAQANAQTPAYLLFKKRLFVDWLLNDVDPVERDLLYHQAVHDILMDRYPITEEEGIKLCALRAQIMYGDYKHNIDYRMIMENCLPSFLRDLIKPMSIEMEHEYLTSTKCEEAKLMVLDMIRSWILYGSSIFEVTQSYTSALPKALWLAVNQTGAHLLERRSKNILVSLDYDSIVNFSPSLNSLMIVTGSVIKGNKYILTTNQASQIAHLIRDYAQVLTMTRRQSRGQEGRKPRPMSILYKIIPENE